MIERCDFLLGADDTMVMVLPEKLPGASTYTVTASPEHIRIRADHDEIAKFSYNNQEVFRRFAHMVQVGMVEYPVDEPFPAAITAVAYVQTMRMM